MRLDQLRLGLRLAIGFGLVLGLAAGTAAIGWSRLADTMAQSREADRLQQQAAAAAEWRSLTQLNVTRTLAIAKARANADVDGFLTPQMKQTTARISGVQKGLEAAADTAEAQALMADIARLRKQYITLRDVVFGELRRQDPAAWPAIEQQLLPAAAAYIDGLTRFQQMQQQRAQQHAAAMDANGRRARWMLAGLALAGLAIGCAAAWLITRSVTRPLQQAVQMTRRIASGDLTGAVPAPGRDEVGELLQGLVEMQRTLSRLVSDVQHTTDSIRVASTEVAVGNQDLSTRTEKAAANLQQTASSMEQISSTVQHTAHSAASANALAETASSAARHGGTVVTQVVVAMQEISERSRQIGEITGLIDTVAFQTNILALNAAVEAARAGEHGRGFAVVAGEVRSLAQRAADAAREIRQLITRSVDTVDSGARLVHDAGTAMTEIVASVQRVCAVVDEISRAAGEQSTGVGHVNAAVSQLDQMTQQNAALVEQSAAAAASLQDQAARLAQLMQVFKVNAVA